MSSCPPLHQLQLLRVRIQDGRYRSRSEELPEWAKLKRTILMRFSRLFSSLTPYRAGLSGVHTKAIALPTNKNTPRHNIPMRSLPPAMCSTKTWKLLKSPKTVMVRPIRDNTTNVIIVFMSFNSVTFVEVCLPGALSPQQENGPTKMSRFPAMTKE